ncbi:hypothetical protein SLEP1_g33011 [Rubroshorea leprosula]|uniref:RanBP2-type domain-containing protein n=1 Tax=Rubroshorea leprosula TaxID=152421 RepID=A0AAV5KF99_9ROSI|nr:hypothetical protein SLEP1_g33011 [Rubroshorea leprosula]
MSSSLRIILFGNTLIRTHKHFLPPPLLPLKSFPFPPLSLRFHQYSSSSAAADTVNADSAISPHPWPEWVTFVDKLKSRGYLTEADVKNEGENVASGATAEDERIYKEMDLLKDACLRFARDRYDLLKLLSLKDVETVVGNGCPNLLRKAVNSAKRLRAYARLDEGDICGICNLRGSCDRAYVILKEPEANARTVDVMRILLFYALDPLVLSGEKYPGRELIYESARRLLSELMDLSETSPSPELPSPAAKASPQKKNAVKLNFFDEGPSENVEMKRGDWICPKCNFMNFSKNLHCLKCKEGGPKSIGGDETEIKKGDWICSRCKFVNFSRNIRCLKCKADGPKRVNVDDSQMKKGDWICPECAFMNFSNNRKCLRCPTPRPKRQLNPGEWECPLCDFVNFRRNTVCLKCNNERSRGKATNEDDDHIWRRTVI